MTMPSAPRTQLAASSEQELAVERLLGRRVRDPDGKALGRIEELIAEIRGTEWIVTELHIGAGAFVGRLLEISTLVPIVGTLAKRGRNRHRLQWNELDLSDPAHPRSVVRHGDLERRRIESS